MENLWSGTDSGLSKDWDDEFDDVETAITYEFPYSELASQSGVSPVVCPSRSVSNEKSGAVSDELKDGNILKSRKTYSKERKNPLFAHYEVLQDKKRKNTSSLSESRKTKNPRTERQPKKPANKSVSAVIGNHKKIGANNTEKTTTAITCNISPEKKLVNGVKNKPVPCEELNHSSEYSLFNDIEGLSSFSQSEESTTKYTESSFSKETLNTGYQRTRKNLKQKICSKTIQNQKWVGKEDSVVRVTNNELAHIKNTNDSRSALKIKKGHDFGESNHLGSGGEDDIFNFQPPAPKKQLSLMDMVKKYSEIQNFNQNKSTSSGKKSLTTKSQNSKTVRATSSKLTIDTNNNSCKSLGNSIFSVPLKNTISSQNTKRNPGLFVKSHQTLNRNGKEISINNNLPKVYPVSQLSGEINYDHQSTNQSTGKSKKSRNTAPQNMQTKIQKPKSALRLETDSKVSAKTSSLKHVQSSVSGLIISKNSFNNSSQSRTQPILNSFICNKVDDNISHPLTKTTKNLTCQPSNSVTSQNSRNLLFHQNNATLAPVSSPLSDININAASTRSSSTTVSTQTTISVSLQNVLEESFQRNSFHLNALASVHGNHSEELYITDSDSDSDIPVENHRTFSLLGSEFFGHMFSTMESVSKSCVLQCLETAENWIAETPYSRELTVKEFCNNPRVMNALLEFLNSYPDFEKLPKQDTKVFYEFPEDFQNVPLYRMLKDYVDQVLLQMVPPNSSPVSSIPSQSVLAFAFEKMPLRECAIMSLLFCKTTEVLKLADVAAKLNFVAMLVIFDEFRQREIES